MSNFNCRHFLESTYSHYVQGEMDAFFRSFDPNVDWTIYGEHVFKGNYNLAQIQKIYQDFLHAIKDSPKRNLRNFIVEGDNGAIFISSQIKGKDGKLYILDHAFIVHVSKDTHKITKVDNYLDSLQVQNIMNAAERFDKTA